jgi:hypothetical protein
MSTIGGGVNIVTDGLVLYLDAANTKSYVSGSTAWSDLSRSGNNGTLVNGPTFNSGNGGSIVFDGSNDYISTTIPTVRSLTGTRSSISIWFRVVNNTTRGVLIADWSSSGDLETCRLEISGFLMTSGKIGGTINSLGGAATPVQSTITISNNIWYNVVLQYDGTNTSLYLNGNLEASLVTTERGSNPTGNNRVSIGRGGAFNGLYLNGNIAQTLIYNRALTAQEVLQNYNATKGRFGL